MKHGAVFCAAALAAAILIGCGGGGGGEGSTSGSGSSSGDNGGGGGSIQRTFAFDFDSNTPTGWGQYVGTTPNGGRFVGPMEGGKYLLLTFSGLPSHTKVRVSFDLYVIGSASGNTGNDGIAVKLNDVTRFDSNFSNTTASQAFPDGGQNPAGTGKAQSNTLGYSGYAGAQFQDTVYPITFEAPDRASTLDLRWDGHMDDPKSVEAWGLDNLTIQIIE